MSESELKDTQPNPALAETQPNPAVRVEKKNFPRWLIALVLIALIAIGILGGYGSGMGQRYSAQKAQLTGQNQEQFQLGMQAMQAGQYEVAKQHFESVIRNDPNFPGVNTAYTDLLLRMQASQTPTFTPSPAVTSTPDLRGAEEIFNHSRDLLNSGDWSGAISSLDSLRKLDITYRTAEVDGMYYIVLRQLGVSKINNTDCKNINLEEGITDLTLAEHFGPLDANADALRTWARMYITAASFWDQDWVQAQNYFAQVMAALPNLSDSSCITATERWRQAAINDALQLMQQGDYCGSDEQFKVAFASGNPKNATYFPTATAVRDVCAGDVNAPSTPTP